MRRVSFAVLLPLFAYACSSDPSSTSNAGNPSSSADGGADSGAIAPGKEAPDGGSSSGDASSSGSAAPSQADASEAAAPSTAITVRVHYPAGTHTLAIRGSTGPLNWNIGVALAAAGTDTWVFTTNAVSAPLEFKPL